VWIIAPCCGLIFGAGLLISGMVQPTMPLGFLDIFGAWDPKGRGVMAVARSVGARLQAGRSRRSRLAGQYFGRVNRESTAAGRGQRCSEWVGPVGPARAGPECPATLSPGYCLCRRDGRRRGGSRCSATIAADLNERELASAADG
jgi:hypothetical protein